MIYEDELDIGDTIEVKGSKYTIKWIFNGNNGLPSVELSCGNNFTVTHTLGWLNSNGAIHTKQTANSWGNAWSWDYDPYYYDSDSSSSKSETKEEKCRHEWKEEVYFTSRIFKTCSKCGAKWEDKNGK